MKLSSLIIPTIILIIFFIGSVKKIDIMSAFCEGANQNLKVAIELLPTLLLLFLAIGVFRASGLVDRISELCSPLLDRLGFPKECLPLALIRPISSSGALAVLDGIFKEHSPDSFIGRSASVISGSTETVFYTIAVYYSSVKSKSSGKAIAISLLVSVTTVIFATLVTRLYFG